MIGQWCYPGGPHLAMKVSRRSWRNWFRQEIIWLCMHCDGEWDHNPERDRTDGF